MGRLSINFSAQKKQGSGIQPTTLHVSAEKTA